VRAVSLHRDVLVVTSAVLQVNCVIVRCDGEEEGAIAGGSAHAQAGAPGGAGGAGGPESGGETFVIDSPVLPDELDALPALIEQARFPTPSGLMATHGDWDHLLGRLAFPELALGCAESTAERLLASPGEAQRELRAFDEELMIERPRPLALGSLQALPVPGRCELGGRELELHKADGHTVDGMAIWIPWARVLLAGDYLSTVEIPALNAGDTVDAYLATLERLRTLLAETEHVVPGHGPVIDADRALGVLEEDAAYLEALKRGGEFGLPFGRANAVNRKQHVQNIANLPAHN
jgi:glyoxylase-like metal-dependent hydrolase (beta-lactamase superfamily II)